VARDPHRARLVTLAAASSQIGEVPALAGHHPKDFTGPDFAVISAQVSVIGAEGAPIAPIPAWE
jgi:hypothetical protein